MSSNLRNQQYFFRNKKLSKEDYLQKLNEYALYTYSGQQKAKAEFDQFLLNNTFHKYAFIYANENTTGDYVHNTKNVKRSFDTYEAENCAYGFRVINSKDSYDNSGCGFGENIYETMAGTMNTFKDYFCYITIQGCRECEYSLILKNCSNCFGCVGLTNAEYCIFNKQYTKEEYFLLVEKIKKHMADMPYTDQKGKIYRYGEFFPTEMSPFGYNETNAHDYFPIEKEEALSKGYPWKDREKRDYQATVKSEDLPDSIKGVEEAILEAVISCPNKGYEATQCTSAFKIVPNELQFYRQKNLPLPRYCPNCRHYERLKYRNPLKLWKRSCMCTKTHAHHEDKCEVEFETSYAPGRPEIIYCERCYQQEVY